ncbi:ribosomal protein l34e [Colletotrichum tofieldiae]|nr:ribosomal protein l34e [Colletotrichum tofieldiae]GKT73881.1 ribosomal protein l34e [Colletotrichum tofieldiae]GKT95851.1 ribosomal protein L34e [Colletotrichum tofieldiae]
MANNGPTIKTEPGTQENEAWDEERLELALNQLKLLHIKTPTDSFLLAQVTFNSFIDSVTAAKKEVQDFQDLRKSNEITKIMDHAAQRRKEEPNGIKAWRTTDHPDWTMTTTTDS